MANSADTAQQLSTCYFLIPATILGFLDVGLLKPINNLYCNLMGIMKYFVIYSPSFSLSATLDQFLFILLSSCVSTPSGQISLGHPQISINWYQ
jgi:hypothetical protein